jgi:prophage antirepressor-like protein
MYRLIMRSKLPAAERFEEWVVGEVLPTIRKTGGYGTEAVLGITAFPTNEVINLLRQQIELQSELIESLRKKQKHARRDEFIKTTRVLFHRTSLSDNEIADALSDFLGDEMPEWVAYQRRKFDEETATRN